MRYSVKSVLLYLFRIAGGQFSIDNVTYILAQNDGNNHLHGGIIVGKLLWYPKLAYPLNKHTANEMKYLWILEITWIGYFISKCKYVSSLLKKKIPFKSRGWGKKSLQSILLLMYIAKVINPWVKSQVRG